MGILERHGYIVIDSGCGFSYRCLTGTVTVATSLCGVGVWKTGEPPHWRWGKDTSYPQYLISAKEGVTEYWSSCQLFCKARTQVGFAAGNKRCGGCSEASSIYNVIVVGEGITGLEMKLLWKEALSNE